MKLNNLDYSFIPVVIVLMIIGIYNFEYVILAGITTLIWFGLRTIYVLDDDKK